LIPGRNWGGKAVDEKTLSFYYYFIQHVTCQIKTCAEAQIKKIKHENNQKQITTVQTMV